MFVRLLAVGMAAFIGAVPAVAQSDRPDSVSTPELRRLRDAQTKYGSFLDSLAVPLWASNRSSSPSPLSPLSRRTFSADRSELITLDLNTATRDQLTRFRGIGIMYADRIIQGRPYQSRTELVTRKIIPVSLWLGIRHQLDASPFEAMMSPPWLEPDLGRLDVNHATRDELRSFNGIGQMWADKIIGGRPYKAAIELVGRRIMPLAAYSRIQSLIFARQE